MKRILFVCTGNICRSPTAHGVFRHLARQRNIQNMLSADSAGIESYHIGEPPDPRTIRAALSKGYDLSAQRARQVSPVDFENFDLVLAMDDGHYRKLQKIQAGRGVAELRMFADHNIVDPYYGDTGGFTDVLEDIEKGVIRLLDELQSGL